MRVARGPDRRQGGRPASGPVPGPGYAAGAEVEAVAACPDPVEAALRPLMLAGLDGDAAAHDTLMRRLAPVLRAFYHRRMSCAAHDAEDLVQETLISVHVCRGSYDRARPFTAWLYAIARHRMADHFRRCRSTVSLDAAGSIPMPREFEDESIARLDVGCLLGRLSAKQACAIRDLHIEGLSAAEAAIRARIGESDVRVSAHRGMRLLTEKFGPCRA